MRQVRIAIEVEGDEGQDPFVVGVEVDVDHDDVRESAYLAVQNCMMDLAKNLDIKPSRAIELMQDQIGNMLKQVSRSLRKEEKNDQKD